MPPTTDAPKTPEPPLARARGDAFAVVLALLVLGAAGVVAHAAIEPASGRISASTDNTSSVFEAARIDLRIESPQGFLFDADGLYPGIVLEHCIPLAYKGSVDDVDIRFTADQRLAGDGLEQFIETELTLGSGADPDCSDHVVAKTLFEGRLGDLWEDHGDFGNGLRIADEAGSGFATTLRVTATVVDDNRAQGLSSDFWLTLEARP